MNFRKKFIGSRAFYASVLALLIPMIVQQGITQFVNLLDNVMVGRLGTTPMSGVAIVNQIVFIFNLTIFGGLSGASIFGAQFYGKKDQDGVRYTLRFRLVFVLVVTALGILVFLLFGEQLFRLYLTEDASTPEDIAATLGYAKDYINIILWGLLPFALVQCFSSTLRDVGETFSPMVASIIAICVNLVGNYLLIFGSFGFPKMGVAGAALATVIARYVEMAYLLGRTYRHRKQFPFVQGLFRGFRVPLSLVRQIAITGTPLLLNETLWSIGTAAVNMCYATRGLEAVAATNINSTVWNLFAIVMAALGNAIGILSGQLLGANDIPGAKDTVRKLLFFSVSVNLVIGLMIVACSPFIPTIYNTEPTVRATATRLLMVSGCFLPLTSYVHGTYFTIRSGGKTFITFLFDCVFTWVVCLPIAFCLCHFTNLSVVWVFFFVSSADIIKAIIGTIMLISGIWAKNVVNTVREPESSQA
ncbi:MAG: MATE family efflux transporter [Acutalibacter sp.]|jgi:putative MATE family efflux protein